MEKIIDGSKISFYDKIGNEIMYMDCPIDECIWLFKEDKEIYITDEMELFEPLKELMLQNYEFDNSKPLKNYKDKNKIVWYSDCYYDKEDVWSLRSVSYLTIEYINNTFRLKPNKPLYDFFKCKNRFHCICFSQLGNGQYSKNIKNGLTLQDDFVLNVYNKLKKNNKIKIKQIAQ